MKVSCKRFLLTKYEKILFVLFLITLPLINPCVRGDGVGYYAYVRSLVIDGDLNFENEWLSGNSTFLMGRVDENGKLKPENYTKTGFIDNPSSVGSSILWAPFIFMAHIGVKIANSFRSQIPRDGYSWPYTVTMALVTLLFGFLGLWISFRLARKYIEEKWAFWGTVGIWFASSLPVYMYLNPSYSHAHSAFVVALFIWYWHRSQEMRERQYGPWCLLGALAGLMLNVHYLNATFLFIPFAEALHAYFQKGMRRDLKFMLFLLCKHLLFILLIFVTLIPTFYTRLLIYGHPLKIGYRSFPGWDWLQPHFLDVLFSANHGLLSWTPILILALMGVWGFMQSDRKMGFYLTLSFLCSFYLISSYPMWHGISSFGNRSFISCTPIFVLGLAAFLQRWRSVGLLKTVKVFLIIAIFTLWNVGFIYQWGTNLIPHRGPISWQRMIRNQFTVVPREILTTFYFYMASKRILRERIEHKDLNGLLILQK